MRENRTSGSGQGAPGNRRSYCERLRAERLDNLPKSLTDKIYFAQSEQIVKLEKRKDLTWEHYAFVPKLE
jgi:hypothetical protein